MAVFDLQQQRMCVRVVYDGVANAGKTTNVRHLCGMFGAQKTREIHTPAEIRGRTLYFDWLQINAGVVSGFPLICQVISVPGQLVLTSRRKHLLASADVVVYVCDSSANAMARALSGLEIFHEVMRDRPDPAPLVIQANKQDQADALDGSTIASMLGRPGAPIVEAIAEGGVGVMDTFVAAVRSVARMIEARTEREGLRLQVRAAETPSAVFSQLEKQHIDPEGAAEMLLEEALSLFERPKPVASAARTSETRIDRPDAPHAIVETASARANRSKSQTPPRESAPRLPTPDVPAGFIWPAHTGRTQLCRLAEGGALDREEPLDENGVAKCVLGAHLLFTTRARRFEDIEAARLALVRAARARTQLGSLLPVNTVLVLQPASDNASWLWTVAPEVLPLPDQLALITSSDGPRLAALAEALGNAVVDALGITARHAIGLDVRPRSFGVQDGKIRYVGELDAPFSADSVAPSLFETVDQIGLAGDAAPFIDALERGMASRLSGDELRRLSLWKRSNTHMEADAPLSTALREAGPPRANASRDQLSRALSRIAGAL